MPGGNFGTTRRERLALYIVLAGCYIHFLYAMYPRRLDMYYEGLINTIAGGSAGFFDASSLSLVGSRIIVTVISLVTSIPIQDVILLPILILPLVLLIATVMRRMFNGSSVYLFILIAYVLAIGYSPTFTGGAHELGFVLLLLTVTLLLIYSARDTVPTSVSLILICVALILNFISYKMHFIFIIFLFLLFCLMYLNQRFCHNKNQMLEKVSADTNTAGLSALGVKLIPIIIIALLIGVGLNQFVFNSFIPTLESSEFYSSGLERHVQNVGMGTSESQSNPYLTPYYDSVSSELYFFSIARFILLLCIVLVCGLYCTRKLFRKEKFSASEIIFLGFTGAASAVLVLYNILGNFETTYLIFCGLMGFGLLYVNLKSMRPIITILIVVFSVISAGYTCTMIYQDEYQGHKDYYGDSYMYQPYVWISSHFNLQNTYFVSDRYTGDYFMYQRFNKKNLRDIRIPSFNEDEDLLPLLVPQQITESNPSNKYYIINTQLDYFVIDRWIQMKSWKLSQDKLSANQHINELYSTGKVRVVDRIT